MILENLLSSKMLINRLTEMGSSRVGHGELTNLEDNSNEYQTAEEIYNIIEKNTYESDGDKALITSDLVILYKNIDISTKVIPNACQDTYKSPNQHVETVIYNDDQESEGSDISENISCEDLSHIFDINNERIDLLNNFGDTLCHKLGDIRIHTSGLSTEYDRHFLFNDPYIKEQLNRFQNTSKHKQSDSTVLPASLLDYICSKGLEDNYNFYIDNIITHVQNTIEQLKCISNGDYLTDKVKAKWRELDSANSPMRKCKNTVLACSASIPTHVTNKKNENIIWDDIIHSEMDLRSLSKILRKKVIVQLPKIICGTYRLFSKRCKDNIIITCRKELPDESQVDVVLKLQNIKSSHVVNNIDSIVILKSLPSLISTTDTLSNNLALSENKEEQNAEKEHKIIELHESIEQNLPNTINMNTIDCSLAENNETDTELFSENDYNFSLQSKETDKYDSSQGNCDKNNEHSSSRIDCNKNDKCVSQRTGVDFDEVTTEDLHCVIHRLNMQSPVIEEEEEITKKKKSLTRVRLKSPYENDSINLEEKKRKKLLEIRQEREIKKNTMGENCKITKNRYGKTPITLQASSSVTKLSITNKYFYSSIYGQSRKINNKYIWKHHNDRTWNNVPGIELKDVKDNNKNYEDFAADSSTTPGKNTQKYINRSYYLDDTDTEVMYQNGNQNVSKDDLSLSTATNEMAANLNAQLINLSSTDFSFTDTSSGLPVNISCDDSFANIKEDHNQKTVIMSTQSTQATVFSQSAKTEISTEFGSCKTTSSLECRRSIDKIYDLIKKISETDSLEVITSKNKIANNTDLDLTCSKSRICTHSDFGTSNRHQKTGSNISNLNSEKPNTVLKIKTDSKVKIEKPTSFISKVTISTKSQSKCNINTNKENKLINCTKVQENPLKAISLLIHKFDKVQKASNKNGNELKSNNKIESLAVEGKSYYRENFHKRIPKQNQHLRETEVMIPSPSVLKEKRRQSTGHRPFRVTHQQSHSEETPLRKSKKIADIIDEVKELRGEAVRGPSKKLTRLNSLALPKKPFPPAQLEESMNRFEKRVTDKLFKQTPPVSKAANSIALTSSRTKQRKVCDGVPSKQPYVAGTPSDRSSKTKPTTRSPNRDGNAKRNTSCLVRTSCNNGNVSKISEERNEKPVNLDKYVKSVYGRVDSRPPELDDSHQPHKSKVPLVPHDFDLVSTNSTPEESTILGKKLHFMIDTMINSNAPVLCALAECEESTSFLGDGLDGSSSDGLSKCNEVTLSGSDYPIDIFKDKNIVTAVSRIKLDTKDDEEITINNSKTNIQTEKLCDEVQKLKNAVYRQISNGAFPNNSETKNFALKSTDGSSVNLKSELSSNIVKKYSQINILSDLSNKHVDFGFTKFPMQISTVGYALSHFIKSDSLTKIRYLENNLKFNSMKPNSVLENSETNLLMNKSIQCFKGIDKVLSHGSIQDIIKNVTDPLTNPDNGQKIENGKCTFKVQRNEQMSQENVVITEKYKSFSDGCCENSNINNTTSLDILVDLLNEIKKITTYQVDLPIQENANFDFAAMYQVDRTNRPRNGNFDLEVLLNKVADKESSIEQNVNSVTSLPSLDKVKIEAGSTWSCAAPNTGDYGKDNYRPVSVDKEVSAKILPSACIHRFTEVPSRFFPVTVSTNVSDSLAKLVNRTPSITIGFFTDCESLNNSNDILSISSKSSHNLVDSVSGDSKILPAPLLQIQCLNEKEKCVKNIEKIELAQTNHSIVEFDPLLKMKRDILVTLYSILVFTVFAALSFPEIMYLM